jgi:hypothetical protein
MLCTSIQSEARDRYDGRTGPVAGPPNFVVDWSARFLILEIPGSISGPEATSSDWVTWAPLSE